MEVKELVVADIKVTEVKTAEDLCECVHTYSVSMDYGRLRLCVKCGKLYSELEYQTVSPSECLNLTTAMHVAWVVDDEFVVIVK